MCRIEVVLFMMWTVTVEVEEGMFRGGGGSWGGIIFFSLGFLGEGTCFFGGGKGICGVGKMGGKGGG